MHIYILIYIKFLHNILEDKWCWKEPWPIGNFIIKLQYCLGTFCLSLLEKWQGISLYFSVTKYDLVVYMVLHIASHPNMPWSVASICITFPLETWDNFSSFLSTECTEAAQYCETCSSPQDGSYFKNVEISQNISNCKSVNLVCFYSY